MDKKKLLGAIIGVLAFAALVVGATYAFFSASGGSANNAVTANATTLSNLGFISNNSKISYNLIPVHSESPYFSRYPGTSASGCIDDLGNEICSVYEFTITNTASVAQTIYVSLVPSENTYDNLYFAAFNTTAASADYTVATGSSGSGNNFTLTPQTTSGNSTLGHPATKLTKNSTASINMPGLSTTLNAGSSVTYTILVWLQDIGVEQNQEQGSTFKAGVVVTTANSGTGVTGILGDTEEEDAGNYIYTISETNNSIGSAIRNGVITYTTSASAMEAWPIERYDTSVPFPFCLKHKINNDVIEESYIVFTITPNMVSHYPGLTQGTYTIKGGDSGAAYSSNASILIAAFGSENCDTSTPGIVNCTVNYNNSWDHFFFGSVENNGDVIIEANRGGGNAQCYIYENSICGIP